MTVEAHPNFSLGDTWDEREASSSDSSTVSHLSLFPPTTVDPPLSTPLLGLSVGLSEDSSEHYNAACTSLSSISGPGEVFWGEKGVGWGGGVKTVYFEHLSAHLHFPTHTLPMCTSKCGKGVHAHRNTQWDVQSQMLPIWDSQADALSPAPSSHCKQSKQAHQTLSTSFCSQRWQCDVSLGYKPSQNKPNPELTGVGVELERERERQKVGMSPSAPWHHDWEGHGECNGARWGPLWTLALGQMAGLDLRTC